MPAFNSKVMALLTCVQGDETLCNSSANSGWWQKQLRGFQIAAMNDKLDTQVYNSAQHFTTTSQLKHYSSREQDQVQVCLQQWISIRDFFQNFVGEKPHTTNCSETIQGNIIWVPQSE